MNYYFHRLFKPFNIFFLSLKNISLFLVNYFISELHTMLNTIKTNYNPASAEVKSRFVSEKKILFIAILFFVSLSSRAQQATSVPLDNYYGPKPIGLEAIESKYYCCRMCDFTALKEQPCSVHHLSLVKVGNYYCAVCGKNSSSQQGTCPDTHGARIRMNMRYVIPEKMNPDNSGDKTGSAK